MYSNAKYQFGGSIASLRGVNHFIFVLCLFLPVLRFPYLYFCSFLIPLAAIRAWAGEQPTKYTQASASTCALESISPPTEEQPTKYKQASTSHSCTLESISPPTKEQLTKHTRGTRVILYFKSASNLTEEPPTKQNQTCPSHPCTLRPITPPDKKQPLLVYPLERCASMVCFRIYYTTLFSMMIITAKQGHFLNIDFIPLVSSARSGVLSFNLLGGT